MRRAVLRFARHKLRPYPWRATRDPWAVLVSEVMLQQTQADRVVETYERFMARFPEPSACAAAPTADVLRAWAGLGYNRRALALQRAAAAVVTSHGGSVPAEISALEGLRGVGPYTARAVVAFAYEWPASPVDTNIGRVLSRAVAGRALAPSALQELAEDVEPAGAVWGWNQGLMDIGARFCRSRSPRCDECPLHSRCAWRVAGNPAPDPAARRSAAPAFDGSDRQVRGRLLQALRSGPVSSAGLADAAGCPDDPARAKRLAAALVTDGLARRRGSGLSLP